MTAGRPRIFDEDQLPRDDATLWGIFERGVDVGYGPAVMSGLVTWLRDAAPWEPSAPTLARYRKILAELVPDPASPPRRRRHAARRGLAVIAMMAASGTAAAEMTHSEPVRASVSVPGAPDDPEAPIMYDRVNRRRRRRSGWRSDEPASTGGGDLDQLVRIDCALDEPLGAHAMASAA